MLYLGGNKKNAVLKLESDVCPFVLIPSTDIYLIAMQV